MYTIGILFVGWILGLLSIPVFFLFLDLIDNDPIGKFKKWFYRAEGVCGGKFYTTDTAEYITNDPNYSDDFYYRSPKGTYFEVFQGEIYKVYTKEQMLEKIKSFTPKAKYYKVLQDYFGYMEFMEIG